MGKILSGYAKPVLSAVAFFATLVTLSYSYAAFVSLTGVGAGDVLSKDAWNVMVSNLNDLNGRSVPQGAVMAFFGSSCPANWSPADGTANGVKKTDGTSGTLDLRGEFVRGLDGGRNVDTSRTLGSFQNGATKLLMNGSVDTTNPGSNPEGNSPSGLITHKPGVEMIGVQPGTWGSYTARHTLRPAMDTTWGGGSETRPRNVALLYCVKN